MAQRCPVVGLIGGQAAIISSITAVQRIERLGRFSVMMVTAPLVSTISVSLIGAPFLFSGQRSKMASIIASVTPWGVAGFHRGIVLVDMTARTPSAKSGSITTRAAMRYSMAMFCEKENMRRPEPSGAARPCRWWGGQRANVARFCPVAVLLGQRGQIASSVGFEKAQDADQRRHRRFLGLIGKAPQHPPGASPSISRASARAATGR
jgi:hypothetical protein